MKLADYLDMKDLSLRDFEKLSGVSYSHVCLITNGKRTPNAAVCYRITVATKGKVKTRDLLENKIADSIDRELNG